MLPRRLLGVLRQYGPEVTVLTGSFLQREAVVFLMPVAFRELFSRAEARLGGDLRGYLTRRLERGEWGWLNVMQERPDTEKMGISTMRDDPYLDCLVPWLARTAHVWWKETLDLMEAEPREPGWMGAYVGVLADHPCWWLTHALGSVADWVRAEAPPDLMRLSIGEVRARTERWHLDQINRESALASSPRPESPRVFERAGYRVLKLTTRAALEHEGAVQGHCVATYWQRVASGESEIYTVVDPEGASRATIEIVPLSEAVAESAGSRRVIRQISGKHNVSVMGETEVMAVAEAFFAQEQIPFFRATREAEQMPEEPSC